MDAYAYAVDSNRLTAIANPLVGTRSYSYDAAGNTTAELRALPRRIGTGTDHPSNSNGPSRKDANSAVVAPWAAAESDPDFGDAFATNRGTALFAALRGAPVASPKAERFGRTDSGRRPAEFGASQDAFRGVHPYRHRRSGTQKDRLRQATPPKTPDRYPITEATPAAHNPIANAAP